MIRINGPHLQDEHGRILMLRGVNLGGGSKVPFRPNSPTYRCEGFFNHRTVSFAGRPFPLAEADEHFARLKSWGLTFLRFLVTWEAVEHAGPGIYDREYLDYLRAVVEKAGEYGFALFIDPHQDVWSRFTGGDGAPGWTLEEAGFDLQRLHETGAAFVHAVHGDPLPRMIWPTNDYKLGSATMFTLFFGGNDFAPEMKINGEPVQEYLQRHYFAAMRRVAECLKGLSHVVGYDTLNEPSRGYIGRRDLREPPDVTIGASPTLFQGMLLGEGLPQEVDFWQVGLTRLKRTGTRLLNPNGVRAWRDGCGCPWRRHGVWDLDETGAPRLLQPDYFRRAHGREADFNRDYYRPFANRFAETIRAVDPEAIIFVEAVPHEPPPDWEPGDLRRIVSAPHWYDGYVLIKKAYNPVLAVDERTRKVLFGPRKIRRNFAATLAGLKRASRGADGGEVPTLLGEFGIPFDLNHKKAYRTGDFRAQIKALDRSFRAIEANLLHATLWNYTADNTNARGDLWNDEDLSLFSRDQQNDPDDLNSGGRALRAAVRPYPRAAAGEPLGMSFKQRSRIFEFRFRHDPEITAPTEIFLPNLQYPRGCKVEVSDGTYEIDRERQVLIYRHSGDRSEHQVRIGPV